MHKRGFPRDGFTCNVIFGTFMDIYRKTPNLVQIGRKHRTNRMKTYRGADKSLARQGRKQATATEDFDVHISYLLIIIGGILVLFIYI